MEKFIFTGWFLFSLAVSLFLFLSGSTSDKPDYLPIEIKSGSGFREVARNLKTAGIIRSEKAFMLYGIISGSAHQLKPGNYFLSRGSTTPAIAAVLVRGPARDKEITFPEGVTVKDIETILAKERILPAGSLASYEIGSHKNKLEGFLFPDTYRFFLNSSIEQVVKKFLDNFEKKARPLLKCQMSNVKCQEILTIASLLEKEAPDFRDRQIIAGILYKRLELGIGLQVDAAITYAKCGGTFLTCADPKVYRKDLNFRSPYNTYLYNGLPPGPIGNPGLEAIKAALNPISTDYLYYLSDPKTKKTIFSQDLEEHNDNRAKYLGV